MKYSVVVKFIAILLCACSLVAVAFSGIGIAFMEGYDLYHSPLETVQQSQIDQMGNSIAWYYGQDYAAQKLSNAPVELLEQLNHTYFADRQYGKYIATIYENGEAVSTRGTMVRPVRWVYRETVRPSYPVVVGQYYLSDNGMVSHPTVTETARAGGAEEETADAATEPMDEALARVADQEVLYTEERHSGYWYDEETGRGYNTVYSINYYQGPEYEIEIQFAENVMMGADFMLITALYPYRQQFIPILLAALVLFAVSLVFLCTVAGRNRQGEVKLAAINRIPLDLYAVGMAGLMVVQFLPIVLLFESAYYDDARSIWDNPQLCLLISCLCGLGISLCAIGFLYAFAAQVKASNNYWLRHTIIGWTLRNSGKVLTWGWSVAGKILVWAWGVAVRVLRIALKLARWLLHLLKKGFKVLGRGFSRVSRGVRAVFIMLPIIWQWLATAAAMIIAPLVFLLFASSAWHDFWTFLWGFLFFGCLVADVAVVCYGGWCFGKLIRGIQAMCNGDLNHKIDTTYLYGMFREFGEELNELAGAAREAARQQMKSERMKTELITNVSHDIKTPLTSIINFVDLLKKPHSEEEGEEYLAVLDRQSQRLKKLIDDLMDMSKASSGNITVELSEMDAAEAVNQALGEFGDKLDRARLTPVFRRPEKSILMSADGKLLWRVLSNLLNNAVKYALPDTRLYVDLMEVGGNAVISIKNISREQLNVEAEELMERFVRGDTSRNTEGSGLGLNIAKSLVELQGGSMQLTVDGDLFKVTLSFPMV